jgi:putative oxidoreductase
VETLDVVGFALRAVLGVTMLAHGYNHWRGPGGLAGTTRWFGGIGLRPARLHALASVLVEFAAGVALLIGLLTPLAAGAVIGTMVVAGIAAHRGNGFFVFKDGFEYVLMIAIVCACLAALGPGALALDHALGIVLDGAAGAAIAAAAGLGGGLGLLAACWRPGRTAASAPQADAPQTGTTAG